MYCLFFPLIISLSGVFCSTMTWIKCALDGKSIMWHFSHKGAGDLWWALAVPNSLAQGSGIQRATHLCGLGKLCHPQGEKPNFLLGHHKRVLGLCWAIAVHACSLRVHEELAWQTWASSLSFVCSLAINLTCSAWAGDLTANIWSKLGWTSCPRRSPGSSLRQRWKLNALIAEKVILSISIRKWGRSPLWLSLNMHC